MTCCKTEKEPLEEVLFAYWAKVKDSYATLFNKNYVNEIFGKQCKQYNLMQDLNYLSVLLTLMYLEIVADRLDKDCSEWTAMSYFTDKYKLDCITKKFKCAGLNIQPMIQLFIPSSTDGIGNMEIEGTDDCPPPFIVS